MYSFVVDLPEIVYQARTRANLTQSELATRAGVSRHTVVNVENGSVGGMRLDKLMPILAVLGLELAAVPRHGVSPQPLTKDGEEARLRLRARFVRGDRRAVRQEGE